ncbi:MAG: cyclic nucleotide-binding domain-containing protein [Micavibrio sp.]|nr:cyclic nucleotide-binding domain-containing protein [Micavibrio sp.]
MTNTAETKTKNFTEGERIISKGEDGVCAYVIEKGRVRVTILEGTRRIALAQLGEGEIFGETAIITNGSKYGADVEAMTECTLRIITREDLNNILELSDPIIKTLLLMLGERLQNTNEALVRSETREYMDIALI